MTDAFTGNSGCSAYASTGYAPFDHDYAYDNLHNLTSLDGPTYSYGTGNEAGAGDAGPHAVTEIGTTIDFGYDDNGNRITKTVSGVSTGYTFNFENRLAAVDLPSDANDVTFVYDADGSRVKRSHGTYSTVYVAGLMEIDRTGSTVTQTRTFYGFAGVAVAVRTHTNAATTFVFQNHLGSAVTAFNDTSNTHSKQYYYPYGAERYAVGSLPLDQRYTGQTSDATGAASAGTGLLYYNARYYDPQVGAFISADTIVPVTELSVGLNRYAYVAGNPAGFTDPSGREAYAAFWLSAAELERRFVFSGGYGSSEAHADVVEGIAMSMTVTFTDEDNVNWGPSSSDLVVPDLVTVARTSWLEAGIWGAEDSDVWVREVKSGRSGVVQAREQVERNIRRMALLHEDWQFTKDPRSYGDYLIVVSSSGVWAVSFPEPGTALYYSIEPIPEYDRDRGLNIWQRVGLVLGGRRSSSRL